MITGPGRSGTSFIAALYKELGFDPGGPWRPSENAGFEHSGIVAMNETLMSELGTSVPLGRRARRGRWGRHGYRIDALLSDGPSRLPERLVGPVTRLIDWSRYGRYPLDVIEWRNLERIVGEHGESLRELAEKTSVVKDPRFCWTLPAWLASGARLSAVVLTLRDLDAVIESRRRAFGHLVGERARGWARNDFVYGVGTTVAIASEFRVPVQLCRFPDFLDEPRELHARLPLPAPCSWEDFERAFAAVRDPSMVHDAR